ncbi:uncharacterized protein BCN122_III0842 [Burkholderia cenocepacia]|nr:uncharacterized protein BCN122_III0842 [Burkholderia cenocepacia]
MAAAVGCGFDDRRQGHRRNASFSIGGALARIPRASSMIAHARR